MIDLVTDAATLVRMREGSVTLQNGARIYVQDDQTVLDAAALLAALRGRPDDDFDRDAAKNIYGELEAGNLLSAMQIATFRDLLARYTDEVAVARAEGDYPNPLDPPDPETARIITGGIT